VSAEASNAVASNRRYDPVRADSTNSIVALVIDIEIPLRIDRQYAGAPDLGLSRRPVIAAKSGRPCAGDCRNGAEWVSLDDRSGGQIRHVEVPLPVGRKSAVLMLKRQDRVQLGLPSVRANPDHGLIKAAVRIKGFGDDVDVSLAISRSSQQAANRS